MRTYITVTAASTMAALAASAHAGAADDAVFYCFDQILDAVIRVQDRNGDGDSIDPDEVLRFFDENVPTTGTENAQGILAVGVDDLFLTDNFVPENIVRVTDRNGDGDGLDPGESSVWFNGMLPGGLQLANPVNFTAGLNGEYYFIDNNTIDEETNPEALYRAEDLNLNDNVNDPGEVTLVYEFEPIGPCCGFSLFDLEVGLDGYLYTVNTSSQASGYPVILRIAPDGGSITTFLRSADLFANTNYYIQGLAGGDFTINPKTGELIIAAGEGFGFYQVFLGLLDRNGDNVINQLNEVRLLWNENTHADGFNTGTSRDMRYLADGTIVWVDALSDRLWRLVDMTGDGDYQDADETTYIYDSAEAAAAEQESMTLPLSITALLFPAECPADLASDAKGTDGTVNVFDLLALLANWGTDGAGADLDEPTDIVNLFDLLALLAQWGPCG